MTVTAVPAHDGPMGWLADKNQQADEMMHRVIAPGVPSGETLRGAVYAHQQGTFSTKLYVIGVTEHHLLLQPVDRKMQPNAPVIALHAGEIEVGNIFGEGAGLLAYDGKKGQEIRFNARGEKYKLMSLGGNFLENRLAGDGQLAGLTALAEFLRTAQR